MTRSRKRPATDKAAEATKAIDEAKTSGPKAGRKPRLMVAGEFSAGKTRLINGLLGERVLPSNVTATALPPIWLIGGNKALLAVDLDGVSREINSLEEVTVEDTHYCILSHPAPFLKQFDIIDTPGNSDPNIPSESWERMLDYADAVIWCSNATQAWRQSEKAVWNDMPDRLLTHSTLLVTHADRMPDSRSADRVLRRVRREAGKYFSSFLMASMLNLDDLARIRAHCEELAKELEPLQGASCDIVRDFASSDLVSGEALLLSNEIKPGAAPVSPRRVNKNSPAAKADPAPEEDEQPAQVEAETASVAAADEPSVEAVEDCSVELKTDESQSAKLHVLIPARASAGDNLATNAGASDLARSMWTDISRDVDLTDAEKVLDCVERFILALGGQSERPDSETAKAPEKENKTDATDDLVHSLMGGRKS